MTCRHCHQPIKRCSLPPGCLGWVHSRNGLHFCGDFDGPRAEPEPGTLPIVEAPASKPAGEVA